MILKAFSEMWSALTLDAGNPRDPAIAKILGLGTKNTTGIDVSHEKVLAIPAVKRAVQIITDKLFGLPWYVFKESEDGREFAKDHPAWNCLHWMANSEISSPAFRQTLTSWAMIWGNGCAWIDRSDDNNWELIPLLPDRTKPVRLTRDVAGLLGDSSLTGRLFIETTIGDTKKLIDYQDIYHIKGYGANPFWGADIIELLREAFGGVIARDEFANRFFAQGANPVGFLKMPGSLDEEASETFSQSMAQAMSGIGKAHKVILLEEGMEFQQLTIDPIKSQMLEGKQLDIRVIAMTMSIKPHKLIDGANSAFASLEQANHEHKEDDIMPWINKHTVEGDRKLLRSGEQGVYSTGCDDEKLDYVPFRERSSGSVELYNNGVINKDEARRNVNYSPSKTARAKQYRIPANILYEDDAGMVSGGPQPPIKPEEKKDEPNSSVNHRDVVDYSLERMEKRLTAQAKAKAKDGKEFIEWLDALKPEAGPASIQTEINDLYSRTIKRLNDLASTHTAEELSNAI